MNPLDPSQVLAQASSSYAPSPVRRDPPFHRGTIVEPSSDENDDERIDALTCPTGEPNERDEPEDPGEKDPFGPHWQRAGVAPRPRSNVDGSLEIVRVADLFCGCGGFSLGVIEGLRGQGVEPRITLAADCDEDARRIYLRNLSNWFVDPKNPRFLSEPLQTYFSGALDEMPTAADLATFEQTYGRVDVLVGGPPCQGHSNLNNATRGRDERNALYYQMLHVARLARPRLVLVENVASAIYSKESVVQTTKEALKDMGYHVEQLDVWANEVGLAQKRRRLVLVAHRLVDWSSDEWDEVFGEDGPNYGVMDVIGDLADAPDTRDENDVFEQPPRVGEKSRERIDWLFGADELEEDDRYDLTSSLRPPCQQGSHRYKSMYGRIKPDEPAQTITTGFGSMGQGRFVHPTRRRLITPHEAARIQGFPDYFRFEYSPAQNDELETSITTDTEDPSAARQLSRRALQRAIGNAVPPRLAAHIVSWFVDEGAFDEKRTRGFRHPSVSKREWVTHMIERMPPSFTTAELRRVLYDVSAGTIRAALHDQVREGALRRTGIGRGTTWERVVSGCDE